MSSSEKRTNLENAINRLAAFLDVYEDLIRENEIEYPLSKILEILKRIES